MTTEAAGADLLAIQSAAARVDRTQKALGSVLNALRLADAGYLLAVSALHEAIRNSEREKQEAQQ